MSDGCTKRWIANLHKDCKLSTFSSCITLIFLSQQAIAACSPVEDKERHVVLGAMDPNLSKMSSKSGHTTVKSISSWRFKSSASNTLIFRLKSAETMQLESYEYLRQSTQLPRSLELQSIFFFSVLIMYSTVSLAATAITQCWDRGSKS